jgi:hypothetical protein
MKGFREFELMILQYIKKLKMRICLVTNIKRIFDMPVDIGEALSCVAAERYSKIFDRR